MAYYTTRDYYTRPYRIPVGTGPVKIPDSSLFNDAYIREGAITEYIAYRQGLPVTKSLVEWYINDMELEEEIEDVKSLGSIAFICKDSIYACGFDISTLTRHFGLLADMLTENMLTEKNKEGDIVVPLPFTWQEMDNALTGITWVPSYDIEEGELSSCYRCLQFLRPRDTAYYMRYTWRMGEKGMLSLEGELTPTETVQFLREVSMGLDEETKMYYSKYSRRASCSVLGPIVSYLMREERRDSGTYKFLALLLAERPSLYLYLLCLSKYNNEDLLEAINTMNLTDYAEGLSDNDWWKVQRRLYNLLDSVDNWPAYHRILVILGWDMFFPVLEDFVCPKLGRHSIGHAVYFKIGTWMTEDTIALLQKTTIELSS